MTKRKRQTTPPKETAPVPGQTEESQPQNGSELSVDRLIKAYKASIARKIMAGEIGLSRELEYLKQLEQSPSGPPRSPSILLSQESAGAKKGGETGGLVPDEAGVPERLRVKRKYTKGPNYMSDAAREVRRKGGKARAAKGIIPNWKHGKYSKNFVSRFIRPCYTTCSHYPCEIVEEGSTTPGEACLDKVSVMQTYTAIIKAIKNKEYDDYNELAALNISQAIEVLKMSLEDIIRDGTMVKSEKLDREGRVIGFEIKPHPSMLALPKLIAELGVTPQEAMITPRQLAKQGSEEDGLKTIADLMSQVGKAARKEKEEQEEQEEDD